jgi:hypothetical protein
VPRHVIAAGEADELIAMRIPFGHRQLENC